jgi:hypothetical protein
MIEGGLIGEPTPPRTLLDEILQTRDYTVDEWCERFTKSAKTLGGNATLSVRQLTS